MECKLDSLSQHDDPDNRVPNNTSTQLPMEVMFKDLNDLKEKGKFYERVFLVSTSLTTLLVVFLAYFVVVK